MKVIELHKSVTASNDADAEALRKEMKEKGTLLINLMSSPGSGKTTLLSRTIRDLSSELKIAVLEADIESAVDAERCSGSRFNTGSYRRHVPHGCRHDTDRS